ncbi:Gfo/Idh/MocA family protein [Profundibacterium mesophilum]|uniref:D-galactose 1-dehydrogenase n=1 Tax=Profundibacterium mesophilum KAUST100406-0324 TaxID=1037889 RepID=A0A921TB32_9RHOB|nr:Gfo/Idh/MocA family oxidoreductase [Profundibacterium mesophilum]KAF0674775.1 D-galactose 1-dehydrogenase [Profundibacterium mesophilum KAUST100406-0324]
MTEGRRPILLAGIGKIARDQHVPAILGGDDWELAATVSRNAGIDGAPGYATLAEALGAHPEIETVSLALPPGPRFAYAAEAIAAGRHVMLEKPPGATLAECRRLRSLAHSHGVTLFGSWHSRAAHAVDAATQWLKGRDLRRADLIWKEDVRHWHPGQEWIWEPGGLGVFDPGSNGLSILTALMPGALHLRSAVLDVPANRDTPIAAQLVFDHESAEVTGRLDWRGTEPQAWDILLETDSGAARLGDGGAIFEPGGGARIEGEDREYPALYETMAQLVREGRSVLDLEPLIHVADAFMIGRRRLTDPFDW